MEKKNVQKSEKKSEPVFAILQSLEIVLVVILYELFGSSGFLSRNG